MRRTGLTAEVAPVDARHLAEVKAVYVEYKDEKLMAYAQFTGEDGVPCYYLTQVKNEEAYAEACKLCVAS